MDAASLYRELLDMGVNPRVIDVFICWYGAVEGCNRLIDIMREESQEWKL